MATKPAQRSTAKKSTPTQRDAAKKAPARKTPAKKTPARRTAAKKALPKRPPEWMTDGQGFAIVAARLVGIPTERVQDWVDHHDGTLTRALGDGTLHYNTRTRTLRWQATCRMGAVHTYRIDDPGMAADARMRAATCAQPHAEFSHISPLSPAELGIHTGTTLAQQPAGEDPITETIPVPVPGSRDRALGDALTRAKSAAAETQPIPVITPVRVDQEQPKGHPEP